jgi:hypothetical protein
MKTRATPLVQSLLAFVALGCGDIDSPDVVADDFVALREDGRPARIGGKADDGCGPFPSYYFEFLDDTSCTKRLPSNRDRAFVCPTAASSPVEDRVGVGTTYRPAGGPILVDSQALSHLATDDARITVILVRRIDGEPHYRYLSNGHHDDIVQPWSSTKFMAMANAAATLRARSGYTLGLTSDVVLDGGDSVPIGDLGTIVHAYDERRYSSNGLSRWFHDIGTRTRANALIHDAWLDRPAEESFGGNYGAPAPGIGYRLRQGDAEMVLKPGGEPRLENQLSTLTMAEFLKRLVFHREDASTRLPGVQWMDLEVLFYGAKDSIWYRESDPQGMEADTAIYVQQALDIDAVEASSAGQWRIFSKLGYGGSRGGEFVHNAYACLPELDDGGAPLIDQGLEFIVSVHLSANGRHADADRRLAELYRDLIHGLSTGEIR